MNKTEIELNGVYEGKNGEHRRIIRKNSDGWVVKYEVIRGPRSAKPGTRVGFTNIMFTDNFAKWAQKPVNQ